MNHHVRVHRQARCTSITSPQPLSPLLQRTRRWWTSGCNGIQAHRRGAGWYYSPRSRHLDRSAVRASSDRDSPATDLNDMKRQPGNTARTLDRATEESALRTAENDALDREMSDLKWKVQHVQEDLEYASRGPRSLRADEDRRRLERDLLEPMHERVPAVERKLADQEECRASKNVNWTVIVIEGMTLLGRFSDRDRGRDRYGSSYSRNADGGSYTSGYDRDRGSERKYRDDCSRDFDRDRSRSWITTGSARDPHPLLQPRFMWFLSRLQHLLPNLPRRM
jgi:hypothetical protein